MEFRVFGHLRLDEEGAALGIEPTASQSVAISRVLARRSLVSL